MATESPTQVDPSAPAPTPPDLKASDFFPPGSGWNQAEAKPEKPQDQPGSSTEEADDLH